jgi:hypothetical protein
VAVAPAFGCGACTGAPWYEYKPSTFCRPCGLRHVIESRALHIEDRERTMANMGDRWAYASRARAEVESCRREIDDAERSLLSL